MKSSTFSVLLVSTAIVAGLVGYAKYAGKSSDAAPATEAVTEFAAPAATKEAGDDVVLARYKGGELRYSELKEMMNAVFQSGERPKFESFPDNTKMEVLKNLVRERLLLKEAENAGTDKTPEVQKQLEVMKNQIVIQAYLKAQVAKLVPESEMQAKYDEMKKQYDGKTEVKARHILVKTQEDAQKIAAELKAGGDFAKIAKEKSEDKGSGAEGGELGYFTKDRMVPEFATAAFKLKKDEISEPVKTDFGWHVIQVEDIRPVQPPKFEDVKEQIQQGLAGKAVESYVNSLTEKADVEYFNVDGKPLKEEKALPASTPIPATPGEEKKGQ